MPVMFLVRNSGPLPINELHVSSRVGVGGENDFKQLRRLREKLGLNSPYALGCLQPYLYLPMNLREGPTQKPPPPNPEQIRVAENERLRSRIFGFRVDASGFEVYQ